MIVKDGFFFYVCLSYSLYLHVFPMEVLQLYCAESTRAIPKKIISINSGTAPLYRYLPIRTYHEKNKYAI